MFLHSIFFSSLPENISDECNVLKISTKFLMYGFSLYLFLMKLFFFLSVPFFSLVFDNWLLWAKVWSLSLALARAQTVFWWHFTCYKQLHKWLFSLAHKTKKYAQKFLPVLLDKWQSCTWDIGLTLSGHWWYFYAIARHFMCCVGCEYTWKRSTIWILLYVQPHVLWR